LPVIVPQARDPDNPLLPEISGERGQTEVTRGVAQRAVHDCKHRYARFLSLNVAAPHDVLRRRFLSTTAGSDWLGSS
jgi:hypothetical protein